MTKKAKEATKEVAVVREFSQANIPTMIEEINAKIQQLSPSGESDGTASMGGKKLTGFGVLDDISTVESITKAHSSVVAKGEAYAASAKELGVDTKKYPCKIDGYAPASWAKALSSRLNRVRNKVELKRLKEAKKLLEDNLSANDKLARDLAKIAAL